MSDRVNGRRVARTSQSISTFPTHCTHENEYKTTVVRVTSELSDWVSLQLIASRILVISTRLIRVISHKKSVHEDECEYSEAMSTSN